MVDPDIIRAARWYPSSPRSWVLKARAQDGGATLAVIQGGRFVSTGYTWQAGAAGGVHWSLYGAKSAARKALREAGDE